MRRCNAILLLGLPLWAEQATAEKVHQLTVSIHEGVYSEWSPNTVEDILKKASNTLQQHDCDVRFELKGPITRFTSESAPADISDASTLELVHRVPADVKVVHSITFCVGEKREVSGCAWRPKGRPKTVIVTSQSSLSLDGIGPVLWAHEFGHTTGLLHRYEKENLNLMTPCGLETFNTHVNKKECRHFLAGPVRHYPPGLGPMCPKKSSARYWTD